MSRVRSVDGLPVTAYLVLGVLAANDEQLTAGEIKTRAELSVGHFYWSPSVSHVRRELTRLLARGLVNEIGARSGKRAITLYETTDAGLGALRGWVQHIPDQDRVVIKHPVILKTWLARGKDPENVIDTLERHLEATRARESGRGVLDSSPDESCSDGRRPRLRSTSVILCAVMANRKASSGRESS